MKQPRTLQFSIRSALIVLAVVALALIPVLSRQSEVQQQRRAVQLLRAADATVGFSHQWNSAEKRAVDVPVTQFRVLEWLLGREFFLTADFVSIVEFTGDVNRLEPLVELPHAETVALFNSQISPELIDILDRMPRLKSLNLSDSDLNNEGLVSLAGLRHLEYVNAMGTSVTADGILEFKAKRPDCGISVSVDVPFLEHYQRLVTSPEVGAER